VLQRLKCGSELMHTIRLYDTLRYTPEMAQVPSIQVQVRVQVQVGLLSCKCKYIGLPLAMQMELNKIHESWLS